MMENSDTELSKDPQKRQSMEIPSQISSDVFLQKAKDEDDYTDAMRWYMVHVQSGKEFVAKVALEKMIANEGYKKIGEVVVPVYSETVYKNGKKKSIEKRSFPGYMCVKMAYDAESKAYVVNIPYVSSFVSQGGGAEPTPLSDKEVKTMITKNDEEVLAAEPMALDFDIGQKVLIVDGPFNNFSGSVTAVFPEKGKVSVNIEIFGRETPIEIDYYKVKKH